MSDDEIKDPMVEEELDEDGLPKKIPGIEDELDEEDEEDEIPEEDAV